jgi:diguanylate cyclase (GGDEF)-like protein
LAARYGGEEFICLFPQAVAESVVACAERIRSRIAAKALAQPPGAPPEGLKVTLSLGVAFFPADAAAPDELVQAADEALYQAKEGGRDQVIVKNQKDNSSSPNSNGS